MFTSRHARRSTVAAAVLALAVVAVGCGDDATVAGGDVATTVEDGGATSTSTAPEADEDGQEELIDEPLDQDEEEDEADDDVDTDGTDSPDDAPATAGGADPADPKVRQALLAYVDSVAPADVGPGSEYGADGCEVIDAATLSAAQEAIGGQPIGDGLETRIDWQAASRFQLGCGVGLDDPAGDQSLVLVLVTDVGEGATLESFVATSNQPLEIRGDRAVGCDDSGIFCVATAVDGGVMVGAAVNGPQASEESALSTLDRIRPSVIRAILSR